MPNLSRSRALLTLLIPLLVLALWENQAFTQLSRNGYDQLFAWRAPLPADERIVIIAQDEASLNHYQGRMSSWPRDRHARLIEKLNQAGAELIVFDYDFSQPATPAEDRALADAISAAGNVILANRLDNTGEWVEPLPMFAAGALHQGFINLFPDKYGSPRLRRMQYYSDVRERIHVSLAMAVVETYENFPEQQRDLNAPGALIWGAHRLPYPDMLINFRGPRASYPTLPYYTLLEGNFDPGLVKGRIVLIGNTHILAKDYLPVPTDIRMPGVEVHAHAISSILDDSYIRVPERLWMCLAIVVSGLLGGAAFVFKHMSVARNLMIVSLSAAGILLASFALFNHAQLWLDGVPLLLALLGNFTGSSVFRWAKTRHRANQIRTVFGRYVSRNVVDVILASDTPVDLRGRHAELTVLFSDIRGFTNLSEALGPAEVGEFLNHYFEQMIDTVFAYGGTLDKLMGDAVMAFFGAPLEVNNHPLAAARCAIAMGQRLETLKQSAYVPQGVDLEIGIGLNTGEVIVGNLGSPQYIDYTVIGDNVNLGSRLEGLNKRYGTRIILSESTYTHIRDHMLCRELDLVKVKGKDKPTRIYELLGELPAEQALMDTINDYRAALDCYRHRDFARAISLLEQHPNDAPSMQLRQQCVTFAQNPPDATWNGVTVLDSK